LLLTGSRGFLPETQKSCFAKAQNGLPWPPGFFITAGGQVVEWSMAPHSKYSFGDSSW
jgi:hypothetical protein